MWWCIAFILAGLIILYAGHSYIKAAKMLDNKLVELDKLLKKDDESTKS